MVDPMELRPDISPNGVLGESALVPRDADGKHEVAEWCGGTVTPSGSIQFTDRQIVVSVAPGQWIMKTVDGRLFSMSE